MNICYLFVGDLTSGASPNRVVNMTKALFLGGNNVTLVEVPRMEVSSLKEIKEEGVKAWVDKQWTELAKEER